MRIMQFSQCRTAPPFRNPELKPVIAMSDLSERFFRNVPGPFYNDHSCIDCGLCPELAPGIFRRDDAHGQSYVWRQPETADEWRLAGEVRLACPTESIGDDGATDSSPVLPP
jgi:ferredoxin